MFCTETATKAYDGNFASLVVLPQVAKACDVTLYYYIIIFKLGAPFTLHQIFVNPLALRGSSLDKLF